MQEKEQNESKIGKLRNKKHESGYQNKREWNRKRLTDRPRERQWERKGEIMTVNRRVSKEEKWKWTERNTMEQSIEKQHSVVKKNRT